MRKAGSSDARSSSAGLDNLRQRFRLPEDWTERYGTTPVLIETFVETPRYTGAVYKASGWTRVGTTQGRGRYDRHTKRAQPKKDIWLRPAQKRLATHPQSVESHPAGGERPGRVRICSSPGTRTLTTR